MNPGIDIEYFEPSEPNNKKTGKLYIDDDGRDYFECRGSFADALKTLNNLIKVIYAYGIESGEKYTLINSAFKQSSSGYLRFSITELYKGDFIDNAIEENCMEVEARMTQLTNWINYPRIKPEITFSTAGQSKVILEKFFTVSFPVCQNIKLELCEFCGEIYNRNETILRNLSTVKFICEKPTSRLELYKNMAGFLQLLSIFTDDLPKMTSLNFTFNNGRTIEHLTTRKQKLPDERDALLTYNQIEAYWAAAIEIFYKDRDNFMSVLNLLIASIENITAEISFLNITTAFEVFHKHFHEDNSDLIRRELAAELMNAGLVNRDSGKWDQILRYHHLFKLTEGIEFFKQNFKNPNKTISLIRDSRNYYTHYSPTTKEIWTPNRLLFANKALRSLLKAVILRELKIPDNLINKLLNNRAALFYQDYENNEYSLLFSKLPNQNLV